MNKDYKNFLSDILQGPKKEEVTEQIFEPLKIPVQNIRENVDTPIETALIKDILFKADAYILLMNKYHRFMYLFTYYFNRVLRSQFQKIFDMPESTARADLKKLNEGKVIAESHFAGNNFIYPISRAFRYSEQHFEWDKKVPDSINKKIVEKTLLDGFHKVEYWLRTDTILSNNLDFFSTELSIFFPKELLHRDEGFDYHFIAMDWAIEEETKHYKNKECSAAFKRATEILNREEPEISKDEAIANADPKDLETGELGIVYLTQEAENERKKKNQKLERFWRLDTKYQRMYYNIIMKTMLINLSNKNAYVTRIHNTKSHSNIDLVVLHNGKTDWTTYNNLITQTQRIYCFQTQSLNISITIVSENEDEKDEAKHLWNIAIKERKKNHAVNFVKRARRNLKRKKNGEPIKKITSNDIRKYVLKGTKYCNTDQVNFVSLELDYQFTNEMYRPTPFDEEKFQEAKKRLRDSFDRKSDESV